MLRHSVSCVHGTGSTLARRSITCWFEEPAGFTFRGGPEPPCRLRYDNRFKTKPRGVSCVQRSSRLESPMADGVGRGMAAWAAKGSFLVMFPMPQAFPLAGTYTRHSSLDQALCRALHATPASPFRGPRSARQGCQLISAA
jgi:hypothetical protein